MWLVVGLGNPGREYQDNRHNIGFMVVDELAGPRARLGAARQVRRRDRARSRWRGEARLAVQAHGVHERQRTGGARRWPAFWKIPVADTVVVHDELDVPFGRLKLAAGGGHGRPQRRALDHRESGRRQTSRGCGSASAGPPPGSDAAGYVLADFSRPSSKELPELRDAGRRRGRGDRRPAAWPPAMNKFNGKADSKQYVKARPRVMVTLGPRPCPWRHGTQRPKGDP